jgi:hypothetical protein
MAWALARERLGAELVGAREQVADRWRAAVRDSGTTANALMLVAPELVLHAGAALADDAAPEGPWCRCGGLLRLDGRDGGRALQNELTLLWRCMGALLSRVACTAEEEQAARDALGKQLDAALRGATAAVRAALLDEEPDDHVRFGGVVAVSFSRPDALDEKHVAA